MNIASFEIIKLMKEDLHIYKNPKELAIEFANLLMSLVEAHPGDNFHLAISGGKTPNSLFSVLAAKFANSQLWNKLHFWWVDERMVNPENPESNFGVVQKLLFSQISIPEENIHRIKGENDHEKEALSYSEQIKSNIKQVNNWPVFDLILLGMGDDGHTASIFPNQLELLNSDQICAVATQPQTGQKRITLTGEAINQAKQVAFLVTGKSKADRISEILNKTKDAGNLPAYSIAPISGNLNWYLDEDAASGIR